jgi:hypothetical protein
MFYLVSKIVSLTPDIFQISMWDSISEEFNSSVLPSSNYITPPKKKQKKREPTQNSTTQIQYSQKFVNSWMSDPQLKGWLKKRTHILDIVEYAILISS